MGTKWLPTVFLTGIPSWNTDKASMVFSENITEFASAPTDSNLVTCLIWTSTKTYYVTYVHTNNWSEYTNFKILQRLQIPYSVKDPHFVYREGFYEHGIHTPPNTFPFTSPCLYVICHTLLHSTTNRHWKHGITLPWLLWGAAVPLWVIFIALSCIHSRDGRLWEIRPC